MKEKMKHKYANTQCPRTDLSKRFLPKPMTKGQLISKCPDEKSVLSKIPTKKFPRYLSKLLNQKNKGSLLY